MKRREKCSNRAEEMGRWRCCVRQLQRGTHWFGTENEGWGLEVLLTLVILGSLLSPFLVGGEPVEWLSEWIGWLTPPLVLLALLLWVRANGRRDRYACNGEGRGEYELIEDYHEKSSSLETWAIPMCGFRFHHEPYRRESETKKFIGRDKLASEFLSMLWNSKNGSGAYLVTGYRGVGKTSFMTKVLHDYADGVHEIPFRTQHQLFGSWAMRLMHCWRTLKGSIQLGLHRHGYQQTIGWRKAKVTAPIYPPTLTTLILYGGRIFRWLMVGTVLAILFLVDPDKQQSLVWLVIGLMAWLVAIHHFNQHRYSIFNPRSWWRWVFRPVLTIHINLGNDRLDQQKILFVIVGLLRTKYRHVFARWSLARFIRVGTFIVTVLIVTITLNDLLRTVVSRIETNLLWRLFSTHVVAYGSQQAPIVKSFDKKKKKKYSYELPPINSNSDSVVIRSEPHFSKKTSNSSKDNNIKNESGTVNGVRLSERDIVRFEADHARWFCDAISPHDYSMVQMLYCTVDKWIVVAVEGGVRRDNAAFLIEAWIYDAFESVVGVGLAIAKKSGSKEGEEESRAPRPFHILLFLLVWTMLHWLLAGMGRGRVNRMLDQVYAQIIATDRAEVGAGVSLFGLTAKRQREYHKLDTRQAESLIIDILEANRRIPGWLPHPDIIIVFDELDKIDPSRNTDGSMNGAGKGGADSKAGNLRDSIRRRKVEVEELLSNLKNLVTVAPCRFIFIAGRDMMDANLADQSANSHLYSSLFDRVFYVPSLLTDMSDGNGDDISSMVEQYVCRVLMPEHVAYHVQNNLIQDGSREHLWDLTNPYECWRLEVYERYLHEVICPNEEELLPHLQELLTVVQDFIYYLTYRSAGNLKKLALQLEQFVTPLPDDLLINHMTYRKPSAPIMPTTKLMLRIDVQEQYQIQLISQIFVLLHGDTSTLIRQYGDKLAVASFSILDFLLKFHSSGFNHRDLERMPELLDINRAPALPELVELLLEMLSPYIRKVDNGLYEYRFLLHFQREVTYISQFSEQDLAAFNFTLDESISTKQHFRQFRDEQIAMSKESAEIGGSTAAYRGSLGLPYIDLILGDLHALDNEYDPAMTEYRNALDALSPVVAMLGVKPANDEWQDIPIGQVVAYVRTLLKVGLLSERRSQYDQAAALYYQAYQVVERLHNGKEDVQKFVAANGNLLPVFYQPYLCLAFLHAKRSMDYQYSEHWLNKVSKRIGRGGRTSSLGSSSGMTYGYYSARLSMRWAELLLFRSNFQGSAVKFKQAVDGLLKILPKEGTPISLSGSVSPLRGLGYALSGLGDAIVGRDLYELNKTQLGTHKRSVDGPDRCRGIITAADLDKNGKLQKGIQKCGKYCPKSTDGDNLDKEMLYCGLHQSLEMARCSVDNQILRGGGGEQKDPKLGTAYEWLRGEVDNHLETVNGTGGQFGGGFIFYALSAAAYRISGNASDASLSLWKIAHTLSHGLSYIDCLGKQEASKETVTNKPGFWLMTNSWENDAFSGEIKNLLHKYSMEAFRWAYRGNIGRLRGVGVTKSKIVKWLAPPLSQSMIVMGAFWHTWQVKGSRALGEENTMIRDMGAFPVHPRILAAFAKGRWYYRASICGVHGRGEALLGELPSGLSEGYDSRDGQAYQHDIEMDVVKAARSFWFLVDAVKNAEAFEGAVELLDPPLGFVYYHLWLVVYMVGKTGMDKHPVWKEMRDSREFNGELQRFFQEEYLRTKGKGLLRAMVSRHGNDEGFFGYATQYYYLTDSFSDPYVNGLWAVDMGMVPVATEMLRRLCCPSREAGKMTHEMETPLYP